MWTRAGKLKDSVRKGFFRLLNLRSWCKIEYRKWVPFKSCKVIAAFVCVYCMTTVQFWGSVTSTSDPDSTCQVITDPDTSRIQLRIITGFGNICYNCWEISVIFLFIFVKFRNSFSTCTFSSTKYVILNIQCLIISACFRIRNDNS